MVEVRRSEGWRVLEKRIRKLEAEVKDLESALEEAKNDRQPDKFNLKNMELRC